MTCQMFVAVVCAALAGACLDGGDDQRPDVDELGDEPARFAGRHVSLGGRVGDVLEGGRFVIGRVEIVPRSPLVSAGPTPHEGEEVRVTGVVQAHAGPRARVLADAIWRPDDPVDPNETTVPELLRLGRADPDGLVGQRVHLEAVRVQLLDRATLWVGPRATEQLLVSPAGVKLLDGVAVGDRVTFTGSVQRMPPRETVRVALGIASRIPEEAVAEPIYIFATTLAAD